MDILYHMLALVCAGIETVIKLGLYLFLIVFVIKIVPCVVSWLLHF